MAVIEALQPESLLVVDRIVEALIVVAPALAANGTPPLVRGSKPIDGGATFIDGRRLLGDGKTWEGALAGLASGGIVALALLAITGSTYMLAVGLLAALGAVLGDIIGSFAKRRLGMPRGAPAPILDQLDFYVGAVIATYLAGIRWDLLVAAKTALIVGFMHIASNIVAYKLGLKKVPW